MQHQEDAVDFARTNPNQALFWEQGTGKTLGTIAILRQYFNAFKQVKKTLILGPVAVLYNWPKEFHKFSKIPRERIFVSTGSGKKRIKKLEEALFNKVTERYENEMIVVINYEGIRNKEILGILKEWSPDILVCDESHLLKSPKAMQSKATYEIARRADSRILLTGTPILNNPMDIFMQFKILDDGATFGKNFYVFRTTYMKDENAAWSGNANHFPKWVAIPEKFEELTEKIYKKASRVLKSECLELPPLVEQTEYVEMSSVQKRMYKEMKRDFLTYVEDSEKEGKPKAVVAQLALTKALRMQQIVSGFVADESGEVTEIKKVPRLEKLKELLTLLAPDHKVIVWCCFRHNYSTISGLCDELDIDYRKIIGGMSAYDKQEAIDAFNTEPKVRVIIANQKAGGTGINLTAASYSIIYSQGFSLAEALQSEARNHRKGSEKFDSIVKITLCAKNTIDELIHMALYKKEDLSKRIIDSESLEKI